MAMGIGVVQAGRRPACSGRGRSGSVVLCAEEAVQRPGMVVDGDAEVKRVAGGPQAKARSPRT